MASEPTIKLGKVNTWFQLSPRLLDFHKPPDTAPVYKVFSPFAAMQRVRPPMLSGPSSCHDKLLAFWADCFWAAFTT